MPAFGQTSALETERIDSHEVLWHPQNSVQS